jgi:hypothetical protein
MRTFGRVYNELSVATWVVVETDANGFNDDVYLTTLIQVLKLNLGESPFWGNWGIPAYQTIMTQVFPDFYAAQVQAQFAPFFAKCLIQRLKAAPSPTYDVSVTTHYGAVISAEIPG